MKRFLTRASVAGLSAAVVAGAALIAAPAASAASIGTLTFNGLSTQDTPFSVTTSGACPSTPKLSTNFLIRVTGGNLPLVTPPANITGNAAASTVGGITTGPFTGYASNTLRNFASDQGLTELGDGTYTIELVCREKLVAASLGEFVGTFTVVGEDVVWGTETTITSASPATGTTNAPVTATFTAAVKASATSDPVPGAVQFSIDGTDFGSPVAVSAGTAVSPPSPALSEGHHNVVAKFVGGSASYANSTSAPFTYSVAGVPKAPSATTLSLSASSVEYPTPVIATAIVTPANPDSDPLISGTVQFKVDGTNVGGPVTLDGAGVAASAPIVRTAGSHTVVAVYSGSSTMAPSTSPSAPFEVTQANGDDEQNIETSILPGTLVLSTPYTPAAPLVLPAMALNTTATEYRTAAVFEHILVTDTRPGNFPWTVSAISSDLVKDGVALPSANETIDAQNVGLTNLVVVNTNASPNSVGTVSAGTPALGLPTNFTLFNNPAAAHVAAGSSGSLGLGGSPKPIIHANQGLGTTETAGDLTITAPTSTLDGTYKGKITFTILGS